MFSQVPVMILSRNTKRDQGKKVHLANIQAAKAIAEIIRTCLGPRAMMKMLMDPTSGIVMTNDGNAILREVQVQHPAAKAMIDISRTQDEEVGDGTTSVVVIAGELLTAVESFIEQNIHPIILIKAYRQARDDAVEFIKKNICTPVDVNDTEKLVSIIQSSIKTKMINEWGDFACRMALTAVRTVEFKDGNRHEIDIKRYARMEKVLGGSIEDSYVVRGIMVNKDVLHDRMRRRIENPRIVLLDCPLEYKKGESQTMMEFSKENDFTRALEIEEESVKEMCENLKAVKADIVVTEKGVSDLAIHYLMMANISVIRRVRKTDNDRLARCSGATIVGETEQLKESDVGKKCGLFEVREIQDETYAFFEKCENPRSCTIVLRGPSKDILDEIARNLGDALCVARNILRDPYVAPGGGATEMELSCLMEKKANSSKHGGIFESVGKYPYLAAARALEVIPRILIQNSGNSAIRVITSLKVKHADGGAGKNFGIDGDTGAIVDTLAAGIVETRLVKLQTIKSAFEVAILMLRIDDVVSGSKKGSSLDEKKGKEQQENVEKDNQAGEQ